MSLLADVIGPTSLADSKPRDFLVICAVSIGAIVFVALRNVGVKARCVHIDNVKAVAKLGEMPGRFGEYVPVNNPTPKSNRLSEG